MKNPAQQTILISGASGFIGRGLLLYFQQQQFRTIGLVRKQTAEFESRVFDMNEQHIPDSLFQEVDVFIHAAYIKQHGNEDTYTINVEGSRQLLEAALKAGVKQVVFISSLAAHDGALSVYGKQKHAIEKIMLEKKQAVIRPGLVLGHGGLFASLTAHLKKSRKIPLFGGGLQPLQTVHIDDLVQAIAVVVNKELTGVFTVAEKEAIPFRRFYELLAASQQVKPQFIPFPYWMMRMLINITGLFGIKIPVNKDNLLGLQAMRFDDPVESLKKLGIKIRTAAESLSALSKKNT